MNEALRTPPREPMGPRITFKGRRIDGEQWTSHALAGLIGQTVPADVDGFVCVVRGAWTEDGWLMLSVEKVPE